MKTNRIDLPHLRNEEHFQFHTEFKASVAKYGAKVLNIEEAYTSHETLYGQEMDALQVIRKSATTEQLADADAERDDIFRGMSDALKSNHNHFNADKRTAAARVKVVFGQYGNVARKPYDEETASITKLIAEVKGSLVNDIATLGLSDWMAELDSRNKAFDTLMKSRYSEEAIKTDLQMKSVRVEIDAVYRSIIERLDALMLINGAATYEPFVRELNARVDRYNNIFAQRKGRNAKGNAEQKNQTATS
jgi:hypothetical protein